jgi:hypothetical protein
VELDLRRRGLRRVGHIIAAVATAGAVATVAGARTLRLGGIGVGHDDRLKDVPCLSLVFSVDRDSYLELFVHFLEVFLQCYGRSEYARGNRSEKIGRSDQWCPSLTRALTRRNFFNVGLLATARAYLSVSETRAETNVTGRAGVP